MINNKPNKIEEEIFPEDEEFCFNCEYHIKDLKCPYRGTCIKRNLTTYNSGWCSDWEKRIREAFIASPFIKE